MTIELQILPVYQGDAIIVNCVEDDFKILIDTGTKRAYARGVLKAEFENTDKYDLLILTHTDQDHIGGLLKYYDDSERRNNLFNRIWFNSGEVINTYLINSEVEPPEILIDDAENLDLSIKQGITLESKLKDDKITPNNLIKSGNDYQFDNIKINILSPDIEDLKEFYKEWEFETEKQLEMSRASDYDESIEDLVKLQYTEKGTLANKSSIALFLNYGENNILLMGDAYPSVIENNIRELNYNEENKLKLDLVKVSHHGSNYGISPTLLGIIDCKHFIISTNGSNGLPFKECLARIVTHREDKVFIYFNYQNDITENIFSQQEQTANNFEVKYLSNENDYRITLSE